MGIHDRDYMKERPKQSGGQWLPLIVIGLLIAGSFLFYNSRSDSNRGSLGVTSTLERRTETDKQVEAITGAMEAFANYLDSTNVSAEYPPGDQFFAGDRELKQMVDYFRSLQPMYKLNPEPPHKATRHGRVHAEGQAYFPTEACEWFVFETRDADWLIILKVVAGRRPHNGDHLSFFASDRPSTLKEGSQCDMYNLSQENELRVYVDSVIGLPPIMDMRNNWKTRVSTYKRVQWKCGTFGRMFSFF